jgi:outer membrane lipoprotein
MKKTAIIIIILTVFLLTACGGPVIRKDLLQEGTRKVAITELAAHPGLYKGKLFILGGIIANTTVTDEGSAIEAIYVPVNSEGGLKKIPGLGRYIAVWPKAKGLLDPMIYRRNRLITVAGTFKGLRKGRLYKTIYTFPVFDIEQLHLWKTMPYYAPYYYPYYGNEFEPEEQEQENLEELERRQHEEEEQLEGPQREEQEELERHQLQEREELERHQEEESPEFRRPGAEGH